MSNNVDYFLFVYYLFYSNLFIQVNVGGGCRFELFTSLSIGCFSLQSDILTSRHLVRLVHTRAGIVTEVEEEERFYEEIRSVDVDLRCQQPVQKK